MERHTHQHAFLAPILCGVGGYIVAAIVAYVSLWGYFLVGVAADLRVGAYVVAGTVGIVVLAITVLWRITFFLSVRANASFPVAAGAAFLLVGVSALPALIYVTALNACVLDTQFPLPGPYGCDA